MIPKDTSTGSDDSNLARSSAIDDPITDRSGITSTDPKCISNPIEKREHGDDINRLRNLRFGPPLIAKGLGIPGSDFCRFQSQLVGVKQQGRFRWGSPRQCGLEVANCEGIDQEIVFFLRPQES